jgi:hypothetical protein
MRGRIFINYRRGDTSAEARSIYQRLERSFGSKHLFMDVDSILKGHDFKLILDETLSTCTAMLVIVGRDWVSATDANGKRRLEDPDDFVRLEIATALKRNIPIIPVRIEAAKLPTIDELPEDLKPLTRRQATILTHENFPGDMGRIERDLHAILKSQFSARKIALTGLGSLIIVFAIAFWFWNAGNRGSDTYTPPNSPYYDICFQHWESIDECIGRDPHAAQRCRHSREPEARCEPLLKAMGEWPTNSQQ